MGSAALPAMTVYVKAGADGRRPGACPFSQAVHMAVLAAEAAGLLTCGDPVPVSVVRPPEAFARLGLKHVPAVVCGQVALDNADDIALYLQQAFPGAGLAYVCPQAELATAGVFSRFCFYMKAVSRDPSHLEAELRKLDAFLAEAPGPFLCGARLTQLDCELMPKLQHLRVACAAMKGYTIGVELAHFWRYMHCAYSEPAFVRSCPCDQEIVLHWADRPETDKLSFERHKALSREKAKYSLDVPVRAAVCTLVD
ncbi:chloride intracellular channel exl-1-like [Pollicipes pollicipes]|uniref:chloride intracellular channel exl-1-like n=1 Tax=Pollicipes pollicipes TaxID=41117 RepID=UPI00188555EF|nr:chloride intracellular channel exl-1-like [Pollicipes pollicipes]